jgi:hypothetical protein
MVDEELDTLLTAFPGGDPRKIVFRSETGVSVSARTVKTVRVEPQRRSEKTNFGFDMLYES